MRITVKKMKQTLFKLFLKYQFTEMDASLLAKIHTESTLDGVNSHGINRIPLFIDYVKHGVIKRHKKAKLISSNGMMERWDGNLGPGVINATICMDRAIFLAKKHGISCVALRDTNHWMRGGTYGWQAANAGCITICFTNTQPNMPPWGGKESRIGNNPFVVAIPRLEGHVVLDMALSQFSFGKINEYKLKNEKLPYAGGWDEQDALSNDPEKITKVERGLPIGYWKGSALSMILDMLVTILSGGDSTFRISKKDYESGISQVFICINPQVWGDPGIQEKLLNEIIDYTRKVDPMEPGQNVRYPGERTLQNRLKHLKEGMIVNDKVWEKVLQLTGR